MYSQYLKVQPCKLDEGVFTSVPIPAHSMIMEMMGRVVVEKDIPIDKGIYLQVGPNTFLAPSGGIDDHINHSCDPNCKMHVVGNRAFLYSLYMIPVGNELTFDYSLSSTDTYDTWKMECKCGSNKCRKVISGVGHLSMEQFEDYKNKGMLPLYITEPGMIQKK